MKNFKKLLAILMMLTVLTTIAVGCGQKEDKVVLNVYNWGEYMDTSILEDFEKEYGIKVNYENYDTNENMYTKLKSGGTAYDICIPSDYMIEKMLKEDMLEKIDFNNIANYKYIDNKFKNLSFDPKNEYSVPYMWGTFGIIYNSKTVKENVDSWDILWDKKYEGEILMFNSLRDTISISLKRLGYSMNSINSDEIEKAKQELIKQKPLVRAYVVDQVKDMMLQEEAAMAVVWTGDAMVLMSENPDLKYVVPKEGSNIWFDNIVIPKGSKHKKEAELFIDFLTRPDISKKNVEYIGYSTPNTETYKMLDEDIRNNKSAYPDDEVLKKCEVFVDLGDNLRKYDEAWTEIKLAK
ncbi:spermidine/putrescine ABC transporter substrate-binding protein [Clostridium aestuarii]|uniref:Spermidine/putrescine ABC transporter substrate-binding protein n=1 Tax=Clostridium aestuarii TaxID=338193 RepID=A0ABT4CWM0_9CLOT|nr:spermidine/putrescine ABC transporter substrate-binding protein [Clostridium aestuarii]MCY6483394.1 spermidine/putrescine ABC transporter substrate-binding protein [Clostridium aestuarii]